MIQYLARRLVLSLVTVVGAVVLSFFLVHLTPGSPGQLILGSGASQEQIDAMNDKIGWNESLVSQLTHYLAGAVQGDLGESIIDGHAIGPDLSARLQITGTIALLATLVSAVFGVLVGVVCAVRGGVTDRLVNAANAMALSAPPFWIGVVLVYLLAVETGLLPATGYVSPADGLRGWLTSIASRCRTGHPRYCDRRAYRTRVHDPVARPAAYPDAQVDGHAAVARAVRAYAAIGERAGGVGAWHAVRRCIYRLDHH